MTLGTTTMTQIAPAIQNFYDGVLLDRALPGLVHNKFGQQRPVDQKKGNIAKFRRYNSLPTSTAPLLEGITPSSLQVSVTDLTETLDQYGAYVEYTDQVEYFNEDPVLTEFTALCGENAGDVLDQIWRDKLNAGTSVFLADSVALRSNVDTHVEELEFDRIRRTLAAANAKPFDEQIIKASTGFNTTPIRAAYICIIHPDITYDLEAMTGWVPVSQYPNPAAAYDREVGSYKNFRFIESTNAKIWPDAGGSASTTWKTTSGTYCDIYSILIFARNAYGVTDLKGAALETIIKSKKEIGGPLEQKGTVGWKGITGLCILNDLFMMRYEVAVTK